MFDVNELILKKAKELGFGDVVVISHESNRRQVRFANNEITVAKHWHERKVELFVEKDKKIANTTITELSRENIERVLKTLKKNIKGLSPKEDYHGIAEGPFRYKDIPETF
ncbi:PmbA/TldA family metallopeptidase, partial [Thermococcus sp.]